MPVLLRAMLVEKVPHGRRLQVWKAPSAPPVNMFSGSVSENKGFPNLLCRCVEQSSGQAPNALCFIQILMVSLLSSFCLLLKYLESRETVFLIDYQLTSTCATDK